LLACGAILAFGGLLHIAAIFGGPDWYAFLGAPAGLVALAGTDSLRPAVSCVVIAMLLFVSASYAFSGAGLIRKLPALRTVLALIGLGLVTRGLLFLPLAAWRPHLLSGVCGKCAQPGLFLIATSLLCLLVGGGYLIGALGLRVGHTSMSDPAEIKPALWTSIASAAAMLLVAAAAAAMWFGTGSYAYSVLAAAFLLRAPVSFHHPMTWAQFKRPIGARPEPRTAFTKTDALLSIVSLLLLLVGIGMYLAALL
jgi:hypothetical protein